ncbi:sensor histidine kinase [Streptomyces triticisoli]|uniref:sensor histidine kinase n=1 Tax=Streptomyces triticisoli TaxID=2182797 RepID=UPI000DDBB6E2|nr:sensor histidine kinase [Streptomyces triticisoli]
MRIPQPAVDAGIAVSQVVVAVLLGHESRQAGWPAVDAAGYVLIALVNLPTVLRSRAPLVVCLVVHVWWTLFIVAGYWPVLNSLAPMLAVYTVTALRPARISVPCAGLMGAVWILSGVLHEGAYLPAVVAQAIVFPAILWRFGRIARRSAKLTAQLRAEQAERARREVAEERVRIARELHDVVAHHMSVISVQAGLAAFVFGSDPATARGALATIGATSTEALEELRRMLRMLRTEGDDNALDAPMPGLGRLPDMTDRVRAGGVRVVLRVEGTPRPLPPGIELCAYRVVQESLTNVLKHAPGAEAVVELRYEPGGLLVTVTDDGGGAGRAGEVISDRNPPRGGHGLMGMHERAKLYGGSLTVGPRGRGGFAVRLSLPTSTRPGERPRGQGQGDDVPA